jgi:hypothetical protein
VSPAALSEYTELYGSLAIAVSLNSLSWLHFWSVNFDF